MYVRELVVSYRRMKTMTTCADRSIATPREAASVFASIMGEEAVEVFGILCLTTKHRLIAYHQISRGGIDHAVASPREVFQVALLSHAAAVVVGHNHPSGDPMPSSDDVTLTTRLEQAGEILAVPLLDHVIVAEDNYYSFKEQGRIEKESAI